MNSALRASLWRLTILLLGPLLLLIYVLRDVGLVTNEYQVLANSSVSHSSQSQELRDAHPDFVSLEDPGPGCVLTLPTTLRIACRLLSAEFPGVYHNTSWCRHLDVCAFWGRRTFAAALLPKQLLDAAASMRTISTSPMGLLLSSMFFLDEVAVDEELRWYDRRAAVVNAEAALETQGHSAGVAATDAFRGRATGFTRHDSGTASVHWWAAEANQTPPCGLPASQATVATPAETVRLSLSPLSGKQVAAALFSLQRAYLAHASRVSLFVGDSSLRELFFRLVHKVRFVNDTSPFFDVPTWCDVVYERSVDEDALRFFDSPYSSRRPRHTLAQYLAGLPQQESPTLLFRLAFVFAKRSAAVSDFVYNERFELQLTSSGRVALLVDAAGMYWESHRHEPLLKRWTALATARTVTAPEQSFPFVALTGHATCPLCRSRQQSVVPPRLFERSHSCASGKRGGAAPHNDAIVVGRRAQHNRGNATNVDKNRRLLEWAHHVHLRRRQDHLSTRSAANSFLWKSIHIMDKGRLMLVPGVLPLDHIHFACRFVCARQGDKVLSLNESLEYQFRVLALGTLRHAVNSESSTGTQPPPEMLARIVRRAVDAVSRTSVASSTHVEQLDEWRRVGMRRTGPLLFGRQVVLAADNSGCQDVGDELLVDLMAMNLVRTRL